MFQPKMGLPAEALQGFEAQVVAAAPLGRTGGTEEVAAAVAFLAGEGAAYVTAVDLTVDGGWANV
jgi:NAD(P)-dependent dehydrogenase (short-subunit alcohol dehydrogenase family)